MPISWGGNCKEIFEKDQYIRDELGIDVPQTVTSADMPHFIELLFITLRKYCILWLFSGVCFFNKLKICGNLVLGKSIGTIFPTVFAYFVSLSHCGNSHNISNIFLVIFLTVMWSVIFSVVMWFLLFFFILCIHCSFRHNGIAHLIDYSTVWTHFSFICAENPEHSCDWLHCSNLELNLQYLQGLPAFAFVPLSILLPLPESWASSWTSLPGKSHSGEGPLTHVFPFVVFFFFLHVFPIPIPPPTSLSIQSLWVFPVHQARALVSGIQPGLVICFTLDNIHVSMLFSQNIPPSPSPKWAGDLFHPR